MKTRIALSEHGRKIGQALQEAVAEAIAEHRRLGRPIVVSREGRPVSVNPNTVRTVRDRGTPYAGHSDEPGSHPAAPPHPPSSALDPGRMNRTHTPSGLPQPNGHPESS